MNANRRCLLCLGLWAVAAPVFAAAEGPAFRLAPAGKAVEATGLGADDLAALAKLAPDSDVWPKVFAVFVDKNDPTAPPLLGAWHIEGKIVRFEPRFPLVPGVAYRVVFDPSQIPGRAGGKAVEAKLSLPKPAPKIVPSVEQVYPSANRLPENQLKFYIHFASPMGRGDNYQHIQLLDAAGKPITQPFLELGQELWDAEGKRFTLFIDPGRIKRGLKPREDLGPVLEEGKRYTLVIDRAWTDADGNPLKETFKKAFTVGAGDEAKVEPKTWKLQAPAAGGREPLVVAFPKPLDHALLHRMLWIEDEKGRKVPGAVQVDTEEKRWRFTPAGAWTAGKYQLVADKRLEDLAGNNLARPFEVDVLRPVEREVKTETVTIPFEVR